MIGNLYRASEFESNRQLQKIGKPVDKLEWGMTPPTVNAYYSGRTMKSSSLPESFSRRSLTTLDDAVNFGGIGLVIGHELTHGFDDQGRKFDPQGNLRDWWTAEDGKEFEERVSCVADEYQASHAVDDLNLNGRLTLGENTADNGGARIALMALHDLMAQDKQEPEKKIDGYTPDQRFFLGFGRVWCENILRNCLGCCPRGPTFTRPLAREWRGAEYARISEGLWLQSRTSPWCRRMPAGCGNAQEFPPARAIFCVLG